MKSNNMNLVFSCLFYDLIDVGVINAEFAIGPTCNNLIGFSCSQLGVDSDKYLFIFEFFLKSL
jgi:hypothetical protein